jgi:GT2 family glycosyltransferase
MCDDEWNTPVGEATACGGDAMMRRDAFEVAGGYTATMIAGEEPELCIRLRKAGWRIWRVDADMTLHDADITRFQQWWRRSVRAGYAYADVSWRYRNSQHRIWSKQTRRAVVWSAVLPLALFLAVVIHPAFLALLLIYPVQIARLALKSGWEKADSWKFAYFSVVGKFAELRGILSRHLSRRQELIEYK